MVKILEFKKKIFLQVDGKTQGIFFLLEISCRGIAQILEPKKKKKREEKDKR